MSSGTQRGPPPASSKIKRLGDNFIGQRLSYDGIPCTVRYIGPVEGTKGDWLGVEWDYEDRGKHDGEHKGVRYFTPKSVSKTCASFVRPTRKPDPVMTFVDAVYYKYATEEVDRRDELTLRNKEIEVSGKIAYEVGFDKIRAQLAELDQLKIVIVDGMRISTAEPESEDESEVNGEPKSNTRRIREMCPRIQELDLSRNLFQNIHPVMQICRELDDLKLLRLNGNRFPIDHEDDNEGFAQDYFEGIETLSVDETLQTWYETCTLLKWYSNLKRFEASKNNYNNLGDIRMLSDYRISRALAELQLEYNNFTSFTDLVSLTTKSSIRSLQLKGNNISKLTANPDDEIPRFNDNVTFVDLSYNQISDWTIIDALQTVFPGLTSLRISHNPVFNIPFKIGDTVQAKVVDEDHMLTIARLPKLKSLNFSNITEVDRMNAEMFYLSRIGRELSAAKPEEEKNIVGKHPRYAELCEIHGEPTVVKKKEAMNPSFLEARLIDFEFYMPPGTLEGQTEKLVKKRELPKGFDAYRLKGIVGRLFGVRPLSTRLVWETGEWDPVAGFEEKDEDSDDDDDVSEKGKENGTGSDEKGKYMERHVELEDGTRAVGNVIDGREARIRVELI